MVKNDFKTISWPTIEKKKIFQCNDFFDCEIDLNNRLPSFLSWVYLMDPKPALLLNLYGPVHWLKFLYFFVLLSTGHLDSYYNHYQT